MNFDQMMESWKSQDEAPLYGVNRDLLKLVLQNEQADLRRKLRREQWGVYGGSTVLLAFSGLFLWAFIYYRGPLWGLAAAAVAVGAAAAGSVALRLSRRRQSQHERSFGQSLQEEIRRNLSLVDYQLSRKGSTGRILLTAAPIILAAAVCLAFSAMLNESSRGWWIVAVVVAVTASLIRGASAESRKTKQQLLPRRQRLSELLEAFNASE